MSSLPVLELPAYVAVSWGGGESPVGASGTDSLQESSISNYSRNPLTQSQLVKYKREGFEERNKLCVKDVFQASNGLTKENPPTHIYRQEHFGGFPSYTSRRSPQVLIKAS